MEQKVNLPMDCYHAIGEVMSYAMLITQDYDTDIFIDFSAHVFQLKFTVYMGGWDTDKEPDYQETFYLDAHDDAKQNLDIVKKKMEAIAMLIEDVRQRSKMLESTGMWNSDLSDEKQQMLKELENIMEIQDPEACERALSNMLARLEGRDGQMEA